jgi:uncharacterized membrane protein
MTSTAALRLAFRIGVIDGLRAMTAPAAIAWAARRRRLPLDGTPLAFMSSNVAVGIFTLLAAGELIADKLPTTPNRTELPGFSARIVLGGLSGAAIAAARSRSIAAGAAAGMAGGAAGTIAGYTVRNQLVTRLGLPDFAVACLEDTIAVGGALLIVSSPCPSRHRREVHR